MYYYALPKGRLARWNEGKVAILLLYLCIYLYICYLQSIRVLIVMIVLSLYETANRTRVPHASLLSSNVL